MAAARGDATDEMLMVRYQRGDREAFASLVRRYKRPIYNFVLRQVRHGNTAEDLTQDVFCASYRTPPSSSTRRASPLGFTPLREISAWTTCESSAIDAIRPSTSQRRPTGTRDRWWKALRTHTRGRAWSAAPSSKRGRGEHRGSRGKPARRAARSVLAEGGRAIFRSRRSPRSPESGRTR